MAIPPWLEKQFHQVVDTWYAFRPQPLPTQIQLQNCKIVSHRGEHDNITVHENTIPAFDLADRKGVWGIELDIRWTRDLNPVVIHDSDLKRVFNADLEISRITLSELKDAFPQVPTLSEIIKRYGKKRHLMVEIKKETYPDPVVQDQTLKTLFAPLTPVKDYHFLSLTPEMFDLVPYAPPEVFLPIARLEVKQFSRLSLRQSYGGINGHYLFITGRRIEKHRQAGQSIGTGYVSSKNCLFREIRRKVEWIFSNHAVYLQSIVDGLLKTHF